MKRYVTLPGQTLALIALMRYGSVEALFTLVADNQGVFANWFDLPAPGTVYFVKSAPLNQRVADYFAATEKQGGALPFSTEATNATVELTWRHDYVGTTIYAGTAPLGTLEDAPNWQIDKIVLDDAGAVVGTPTSANGSWTDRLTLIYS